MAARFSLAPPTKGNNNFNAVDILGVPSLEWIRKFSTGQVGVAQSCFDSFFKKTTAGLDPETLEIFSNLAKKNNELPSWGLPALESTLIKSVFETQKPYIEVIMSTLDALITVEDVIAVLKGGISSASLKPKTNQKSLYTKVKGIKSSLETIHGNAKPGYSSFANFSFSDKLNGINTDELLKEYKNKPKITETFSTPFFDWATISAFYSTGEYIDNISYNYTYIDIEDVKPDLSVPPFEIPEARNDDKPPVVIFDIWVDKLANNKFTKITDINMLPNDWDISTKWFGQWNGWTKTESGFINEYTDYTNSLLDDEFDKNKINDTDLRNQVKSIFKKALPLKKDLYNQYLKGNFKEAMYQEINIDLQAGTRKYAKVTDNVLVKEGIGDYWHTEKDEFGYKPRKLNGNWIDPEVDYHLRLVRVFPENCETSPYTRTSINIKNFSNNKKNENKSELSGSNPLVFSYGSETLVDEVLLNFDYLKDSPVPSNYIPDGYKISKTSRKYPESEKTFTRDIIDKIRKGNSDVVEKVIIGDFNITGDLVDILTEMGLSYERKNLGNDLQKDLDNLLVYNKSPIRQKNIYMYNVVNEIILRLKSRVGKKILEEIGEFQINAALTQSIQNIQRSMIEQAKGGDPLPSSPISRTFNDLIKGIGDLKSISTADMGERVVLKTIGTKESLYGKYETSDIWIKDTVGISNISGVLNKAMNTNKDKKEGGGNIKRVLNGDTIENLKYVGDPMTLPPNPNKGDTLNKTEFLDTGIFYIVEGIYKNRKDFLKDDFDITDTPKGANAGNGPERYYKFGKKPVRPIRSLAAAIAKFAQFGATTLPSIIKETSKALSIFKNPFNLIFEIIFEQLSETFEAFDPKIMEKFSKLKSISINEEKRKFIENDPSLRNFIALDSDFNYRFVFDGVGVIALFGKNFGIGIKENIPSLILEDNGLQALFCSEVPPTRGGDNSGNYDSNGNIINNINNIDQNNISPSISSGNGSSNRLVGATYELINVEYSTGDYKKGINYQYYYITLDNQALVNKANAYLAQAETMLSQGDKIRLKMLALQEFQKALVKDPDNVYLNKQLDDVSKQNGVQVNIIFQFLISVIMIPIKIVICIIEYILDFFTNLKVKELPTEIPKFLKFEWILEFFKPTKILALLGMELNPELSPLWLTQALTADPSFKFDVSKIFSAPFLGRLPVFSSNEYPHIVKGGPKILLTMGGVFSFLEKIINEILCFLFNLFNLEKIFPCPKINLSRFVNETLTNEDINDLLKEADYNFLNQTSDLNNNETAFIYDVTLDDGEIIKDLNRSELQAFVASNRNLRYKYNFDGII